MLTAVAGARRGASAEQRLRERAQQELGSPEPNKPGFATTAAGPVCLGLIGAVTQATVLALIGLVFGAPLDLAIGRTVADYPPLQYVAPMALWALLLVAPVALLIADALAAWPGRRAAHLRVAQVLRTE